MQTWEDAGPRGQNNRAVKQDPNRSRTSMMLQKSRSEGGEVGGGDVGRWRRRCKTMVGLSSIQNSARVESMQVAWGENGDMVILAQTEGRAASSLVHADHVRDVQRARQTRGDPGRKRMTHKVLETFNAPATHVTIQAEST